MKKMLFYILRVFKRIRRFIWKIQGKSGEDLQSDRITTGKAWDEFCDQLKAAGAALMYPGTPRDPFQQAEGVRYLSRLTRAGLEAFVEYNDPAFPVFRRLEDWLKRVTKKLAAFWILVTQAGGFLGYFFFGFIADRLGRRPAYATRLWALHSTLHAGSSSSRRLQFP